VPDAKPAKSLAPAGVRVAGMVMACPLGVQLLGGNVPTWWRSRIVVIAEGEPDWLTWASRQPEANEDGPAVFGVESGAWTPDIAARIPDGVTVVIRTHLDDAGDRYAAKIAGTLRDRCEVLRAQNGGVK
jgi:hypothetical protein